MARHIPTAVDSVKQLFKQQFGTSPESCRQLPESGSNRVYYRLKSGTTSAIGTYNPDPAENRAFLYITGKLKQAGVFVPEIFASDEVANTYLQEDLGNTSLFDFLEQNRSAKEQIRAMYQKVIDQMPAIQYLSSREFDYGICYPREAFDKQSIRWDLNYFKYHFLKLAGTPFHEQKLEDDFNVLSRFLLEAPSDFFLYRDFQSRNIMLHDGRPCFIDYQGGRRGALQYDLASLLYEAKANLPADLRKELLEYYLAVYGQHSFFNKVTFMKYYAAFALIRQLQAFGAYGYRGYFERKAFFLKSIPFGLQNLESILSDLRHDLNLEYLEPLLRDMIDHFREEIPVSKPGMLNLSINSFSFKNSIPADYSGNGGGYVFDCRGLPNPGRFEAYRQLTGNDKEVQVFLEEHSEVKRFLDQVKSIAAISIENYLQREFEHLMFNFGCTGGQHRSVYCAGQFARWAADNYNVHIVLRHRELKEES